MADVEAISKIKLAQRHSEDFIVWQMEKSRLFTVKSAYDLAIRLANRENSRASSSMPDGVHKPWSRVWSGRLPPKVNVFSWKLTIDILPTRHAKFKRRLEVDVRCTFV